MLRSIKDLDKIDGDFKKCYAKLAELKAELSFQDDDEVSPELLGLHLVRAPPLHGFCYPNVACSTICGYPDSIEDQLQVDASSMHSVQCQVCSRDSFGKDRNSYTASSGLCAHGITIYVLQVYVYLDICP